LLSNLNTVILYYIICVHIIYFLYFIIYFIYHCTSKLEHFKPKIAPHTTDKRVDSYRLQIIIMHNGRMSRY